MAFFDVAASGGFSLKKCLYFCSASSGKALKSTCLLDITTVQENGISDRPVFHRPAQVEEVSHLRLGFRSVEGPLCCVAGREDLSRDP